MQPFRAFGLVTLLTICTGEAMAEVMWFRGNTLSATNSFTLLEDTPNCSQEVKIFSNLTGSLPQRLISCLNAKLWTTDVSSGMTNLETMRKYSLEHVSLNCSRRSIISGYNHQIEWQASLQISANTTDPVPPFDNIVFVIICSCPDCSGFNIRHVVAYPVQKAESNKTLPNDHKPITAGTSVTDLLLNSTLPTPSPSIEHKKTLGIIIGIPVGLIAPVLVVVLVWVCYRHHKGTMQIKTNIQLCLCHQNNDTVNTTESIEI